MWYQSLNSLTSSTWIRKHNLETVAILTNKQGKINNAVARNTMWSYVRTTAVQTKLKLDIYNNIEMGHFSTDLQEQLKQNKKFIKSKN